MVEKKASIYKGKAKELFATDREDQCIFTYLDQLTALNGKRMEEHQGKGKLTLAISNIIFECLKSRGIKTHWIEQVSDHEVLVEKADMIPMEVVLRNYTGGSFAKRFNLEPQQVIDQPIIEFYYKNDELDDPFMNDAHALYLGIVTEDELKEIYRLTREINELLKERFAQAQLILADFKLEFGRNSQGQLILADEFSPDNCRLWDKDTMASLDKDIFRKETGDVLEAYKVVLGRLEQSI